MGIGSAELDWPHHRIVTFGKSSCALLVVSGAADIDAECLRDDTRPHLNCRPSVILNLQNCPPLSIALEFLIDHGIPNVRPADDDAVDGLPSRQRDVNPPAIGIPPSFRIAVYHRRICAGYAFRDGIVCPFLRFNEGAEGLGLAPGK